MKYFRIHIFKLKILDLIKNNIQRLSFFFQQNILKIYEIKLNINYFKNNNKNKNNKIYSIFFSKLVICSNYLFRQDVRIIYFIKNLYSLKFSFNKIRYTDSKFQFLVLNNTKSFGFPNKLWCIIIKIK